jgi:hypothetical protein
MKTIEDLNSSIKKGEIKTNFISRFLEKNQEMKDLILLKSINIEKYYINPNILQRLKFILNKEIIELCGCGNPLLWRNFTKGYNKTCGSKECSVKKNIESVKKYYTEKYGVDHLFKTDKFKNDIKNKFKEKYGVDNPFKSKEIKNKIKETNLLKFGETNWLKVPENREKIANKIIENNRIAREEKIINNKIPIEIIQYIKDEKVIINCNKCNNKSEFSISFFNKKIKIQENPCLVCNPLLRSVSKGEIELFSFIESIYKGNIIKNDRKILNGKEIDVYLPDLMMAFEFNGIYYHSEIFKDKKDCLYKKKLLSDKSINLITVWEDDWEQKKEIIKSRIKSLLNQNNKIYARKCKIIEISGNIEKKFLMRKNSRDITRDYEKMFSTLIRIADDNNIIFDKEKSFYPSSENIVDKKSFHDLLLPIHMTISQDFINDFVNDMYELFLHMKSFQTSQDKIVCRLSIIKGVRCPKWVIL